MVFTTQCPKCGKILWFSNKLAGTLTICPACGGTMRLEPPAVPSPAETMIGQNVAPVLPVAGESPQPSTQTVAAPETPATADDTAVAMDVAAQPEIALAPALAHEPVVVENAAQNLVPEYIPAPRQPVLETFAPAPPQSAAAALEGVYVEAPDADDRVPAVVARSFLTHQAAAAVGEVHVDGDQSDLVQWTQPQPTAPPPAAPPVWSPPPLSGGGASSSVQQQQSWFPPPASGQRTGSSIINSRAGRAANGAAPQQVYLWVAAAAAALAIIMGIIWVLPHSPSAGPWEQSHRSDILDLKQSAEQLAISGKYRDAYEKYQELERLVAGQQIEDPYLQGELTKSWQHRDALYDTVMKLPPGPAPAPQLAQTRPAPQTSIVAPVIPAEGSQLATQAPLVPQTSTRVAPPLLLPPQRPVLPAAVSATAPAPSTAPLASAGPGAPRRPNVRASARKAAGVTDAQIGAAITKGAQYILDQFDGAQLPRNIEYHDGLDSLALYALLQSGLATHDKRLDIHSTFIINAIEALKNLPMRDQYITYSRALRATALALYDRPEDHWVVQKDVEWLLRSQEGGAFTYTDEFPRHTSFAFWDNSNSQYGLLGVWSGADVGIQVPSQFWRDVQRHWSENQLADGQWGYSSGAVDPRQSMTLAGIASLFVSADYLDADSAEHPVGKAPFSPALTKGLAWLEKADNSTISATDVYYHYTLYGLERVGLASGFKYFGSHDWYRDHADEMVSQQLPQGNWGSETPSQGVVDTAYTLLFLARGRHPIIMNKLRFEGDWANRPRDAANLAHFASADLERPLNWQVVPQDHDWHDWADSPILYFASDKPPVFSDADREKFKQYIQSGGMLLTQADGGSAAFSTFVENLGKQMFPQYSWIDLPADHPLLSTSYKITAPPPTRILTNGSRILMMHWPTDVTVGWQLRHERENRPAFEMGINLLLYAAGKSELKNRLVTDYIPDSQIPPAAAIRVARLSYKGNWDPEPAAFPRADRWFRQATGLGLTLEPTTIENLAGANPPLAHLTGTERFAASNAQVASIQKYVKAGGVLVIDPCGAPNDFYHSVHDDLLPRAFPDAQLQNVDTSSPMLAGNADGMTDVSSPQIREFVRSLPGEPHTRPQILKVGKGHVILLPLDLTSGLLGTDAWGIAGYQPDYAQNLLKNIVLWTWDGAKDQR